MFKTQLCNAYGSPNLSDVNIGKLIIFFISNAIFKSVCDCLSESLNSQFNRV